MKSEIITPLLVPSDKNYFYISKPNASLYYKGGCNLLNRTLANALLVKFHGKVYVMNASLKRQVPASYRDDYN